MKIIETKTYIQQTVECYSCADSSATLISYQRDGWQMVGGEYDCTGWGGKETWTYQFEKELKEESL